MKNSKQLRISEIFFSLQGETTLIGLPTVFIRLTGCPLRCQYCDTSYAFKGGEMLTFESLLNEVKKYKTKFVTVSGGEPLAQPNCVDLLTQLCDLNYQVSLETSGAIDISSVDSRAVKILDIKTPASNEAHRNRWENLNHLQAHDQIKFVICDRADYEWSKSALKKYPALHHYEVLFSPSYEQLALNDLADWVIDDQLPVRVQTQLHKVIWGNIAGK